jgi:hypothetical protein
MADRWWKLRVDELTLERWKRAARERGIPLSLLVRWAVEEQIAGVSAITRWRDGRVIC